VRYRFYSHATQPQFRLVLRECDPFPGETTANRWVHSRDREESDVAAEVRNEIAERGYFPVPVRCEL
jgi:hypothetical protein